ncbi:MAG: cell surface protein SprA, partial [Bacteroidales bacterium]|nr:cell surface protein SprA [Bacteroidales bacterium]
QVGDFSDQGINTPKALKVKLLRSTATDTRIPIWKLMMKNVYNLNAYQVNREDFVLNILFSGSVNSVPTGYLLEGPPDVKGVPLIRVLNFDNLNPQLNPPQDGFFDFIDGAATQGGTIQASSGRIYFTVIEPFGGYLRRKLVDPELGNKYAFDSLYSLTKSGALQYPDKNKFILEGMYKSSSGSEIALNAINVPRGSVKVTAGGIPLTENVHFHVDYTLGRVRIIDEGILNSGTPVNISLESTNMFNIQTKRLFGTRVEHRFSNKFFIGATFMNLHERPLTQKVSFGNEPISNSLWGVDFGYQTESMGITRLLDRLPFYSSKTPSRISMDGEFAHFIPGHSKAVGKTGTTYIDDFEGSKSTIDLRNIGNWHLASTPQFQTNTGMFPEAAPGTGLKYGFNRAKLAWYNIDRSIFYEKTSNVRPPNIDKNELSRHSVRAVRETEVFPNADPPSGQPMIMDIMNLAYYPSDKGPYNFDMLPTSVSRGINADGTLRDPRTRWGGIMRALDNTDFEATNIEYIEFWMMDPFAEDSLHPGGNLYFNLGDVSEDILRDGRKSFENGLPPGPDVTKVDTTIWGRVPTVQALVNAFDNDPNARIYQDVGYEGLSDKDERTFFSNYLQLTAQQFGAQSGAYSTAFGDPSNDNFQYFRGTTLDNDDRFRSIARRYRDFNGPDGNSPASQQYTEDYPTLFNSLPNVEDLNRDNTLSESERYYQYKVEMKPGNMKIGENYIADIQHARNIPLENGTRGEVKWYQFKIPLRSPNLVVGNIQDFRSIRFMRMFFKGWDKEVILRFATLELVRSEWRRYYNELFEPGDWIPNQPETHFEISTVNIEANGYRQPIPYVLPPGIEREINLGTIQQQQKNEQSMVLRVCGLADGDARGAYKTTDFDFRQFKRLQMYVHAEKIIADDELKTGDLTAFIRIGSDFTQNYYEYEVPLEFTQWHTSSVNAEAIWPGANSFDVELEKLVDAKKKRNEQLTLPGTNITVSTPFYSGDGKNRITVVGNPSLSDVKALMIGVRNHKKRSVLDNDDGRPKCAEVWFNELRLTDFNNKSGWAATARANVILADIGNIMLSGLYNTPGFGSIEKRVSERTIETYSQFDIATNLELGKLLPESLGLRIPMHYDYSEARSTPQYNPLDPDILYRDEIKDLDKNERDSLRLRTQELSQRKNLNFMNIRKERTGKATKIRLWDIENIDLSYAYSEINRRNIDIQYDMKKTYRGGIGYNFSHNPSMVKPFDKITNIRLIKDFNFYYMPRSLSFRTDMNREYNEQLLRNKSTALIKIDTTYIKRWDWSRLYDLKYDITQGLKVEFNANASAFVDEPAGAVDRSKPGYNAVRDSIIDEIYSMGTINNYTQNFDVNYVLPINKLKLFDWVYINARYSGTFRWQASPRSVQAILGNTIENNNSIQINSNLRFSSLYNKVDFLKKVNQVSTRYGASRMPTSRPGDRQAQQQPKAAEADTIKTPFDFSKVFKAAGNTVLRIMIGLKDGSLSYTENNGTLLPGFMPEPTFVGNRLSDNAPGWGFVFGDQKDIRYTAVQNGWLSTDSLLNIAYLTRSSKNLVIRANFEPLPDLRIELTADRTEAINHQEYFKMGSNGQFNSFSAQQSGSFSMSYIMWNSAFISDRKDHSSQVFERLKENRLVIAQRLARDNPLSQGLDTLGFPDGYGQSAPDVLIPAFLSAYSGQDASKINLNIFPKIPLPCWRVIYNGFSNMEFFRKYFRNFTISHSYRTNYNIGSYLTNLEFVEGLGIRDVSGNFISDKRIEVVTITEQFSPLLNIDMTWHNSLLTKLEMKRSRNLAFSFVNNQLTQVTSNEYVLGLGYRIQNVKFLITSIGMGGKGRRQQVSSDLNLKVDVSMRENKTVLRRVDEELDQVSAGQNILSINASADYMMNQNLSVRVFFERTATNPFISNQFPNSSTFAGISLRFSLAQ